MNNPQLTTVWSSVMVEELIRQGASFFCISPGSRSTPLTAAIARNPEASWKMFPDERSAGFFCARPRPGNRISGCPCLHLRHCCRQLSSSCCGGVKRPHPHADSLSRQAL